MIGQENSHRPLNQSDAKLKPILVTRVFSRLTIGRLFGYYFEFSLAPCKIYLCSGSAVVITLVLVLRRPIEKRSSTYWPYLFCWKYESSGTYNASNSKLVKINSTRTHKSSASLARKT